MYVLLYGATRVLSAKLADKVNFRVAMVARVLRPRLHTRVQARALPFSVCLSPKGTRLVRAFAPSKTSGDKNKSDVLFFCLTERRFVFTSFDQVQQKDFSKHKAVIDERLAAH